MLCSNSLSIVSKRRGSARLLVDESYAMVTTTGASKQCGVDEKVEFCEEVEIMMFVSGQTNEESFRASGNVHALQPCNICVIGKWFRSKAIYTTMTVQFDSHELLHFKAICLSKGKSTHL